MLLFGVAAGTIQGGLSHEMSQGIRCKSIGRIQRNGNWWPMRPFYAVSHKMKKGRKPSGG